MLIRPTGARVGAALLAAAMLQGPPAPALAGFFGPSETPALNYCAVERAPLVAIDRQYSDAEHSRIYKAIGTGVVTMYGGLLVGVLSRVAGSPGARPTVSNTQITYAVLAGIAASVGTYLKLKEQAGVQDRRALALAVDADAGQQLASGRYLVQEAYTLASCRQRQLADFRQRAAAPGADAAALAREKQQILEALRDDIALTDRVVGRQEGLARTFTEARAMAEGQPEAKVLGTQPAAFPLAASAPVPLLPSNSPFATQPPPVAAVEAASPGLKAVRSTSVRAAPSAKAKVVETVEAQQPLTPWAGAPPETKPGWTVVDANGQAGYVRSIYVSAQSSAAAAPGALPPAQNVRAYNKVVLEARDDGPDRMRTLLTSFQ